MLNLKLIRGLSEIDRKTCAKLLPLLNRMFHEVMYMPDQKPYFSEDRKSYFSEDRKSYFSKRKFF